MMFLPSASKEAYQQAMNIDLNDAYLLGATVLISPTTETSKTASGIYVPDTVERSNLIEGFVIKTGPGYQNFNDPVDTTLGKSKTPYYPLEVERGDMVVFNKVKCTKITIKQEELYLAYPEAILIGQHMNW